MTQTYESFGSETVDQSKDLRQNKIKELRRLVGRVANWLKDVPMTALEVLDYNSNSNSTQTQKSRVDSRYPRERVLRRTFAGP